MCNTLNIRFNSWSFSKFAPICITKHGLTHTNVKSSFTRTFILLSPLTRKTFQVDFSFKKKNWSFSNKCTTQNNIYPFNNVCTIYSHSIIEWWIQWISILNQHMFIKKIINLYILHWNYQIMFFILYYLGFSKKI